MEHRGGPDHDDGASWWFGFGRRRPADGHIAEPTPAGDGPVRDA